MVRLMSVFATTHPSYNQLFTRRKQGKNDFIIFGGIYVGFLKIEESKYLQLEKFGLLQSGISECLLRQSVIT